MFYSVIMYTNIEKQVNLWYNGDDPNRKAETTIHRNCDRRRKLNDEFYYKKSKN